MKRISMVLTAVALILGLSQCKKQEQPALNEDGTVTITLDVKVRDSSKINVNPNNGRVAFEYGDTVYVASGGKFVGILANNGITFSGNLTNPTTGQPLYFFFLGNKTPAESPTPGSSTSCSVNISDQTSKLPVISFATSNKTFTGAGLYTAFFLNKAALVKFDITTQSSTPTCILGMNNKVTVDFSNNSFAYSQDGEGAINLTAGSGERWAILLPQAAMSNVSVTSGRYEGTIATLPAISNNDYLSEGIAVSLTAPPEGAIASEFSVSATQQVYFSQGNLQYQASTNTWQFAEHQWDYIDSDNSNISSTYSGWIDLFGWGTSGYHDSTDPYNVNYQPWSTSMSTVNTTYNYYGYDPSINMTDPNLTGTSANYDWGVCNAISNGGNTEGLWRTLTIDEWDYVFFSRSTPSGIRYAKATVNDVEGVILLPDDWNVSTYTLNNTNIYYSNFNSNTITAADWTNTLEANGAVFLPAAGNRIGATYENAVGDSGPKGYYWSSSYYNHQKAYPLYFTESSLSNAYYYQRFCGFSVRLVYPVE